MLREVIGAPGEHDVGLAAPQEQRHKYGGGSLGRAALGQLGEELLRPVAQALADLFEEGLRHHCAR